MTGNIPINTKQGQKIKSLCRDCHRETKHEIIADAISKSSHFTKFQDFDWTVEWQIVRCLGCEGITFRKSSGSSDDWVQIGDNEYEYQPLIETYPIPVSGRQFLSGVELLPHKAQLVYQESIEALNNAQPVLCGIGVRAILETVCKDKSAEGKDLYLKINSLVELGVLSKNDAAILHKLRIMGNDAAHEVKPHNLIELGLALDVVDHMLRGVYILPEHTKQLLPEDTSSASKG